MIRHLFTLLLTASAIVSCGQHSKIDSTYTLSVEDFDRLANKAIRLNTADRLIVALNKRVTGLNQVNAAFQSRVNNLLAQIASYQFLDENWKTTLQTAKDGFEIQKEKLKAKIRRWVKIAISEGVVIIVLVIILV